MDERWANVKASVGTPEYDILDPAPDWYYKEFVEFRVDVNYDGWTYWQVQTVHRDVLTELDGIYAFIWDEMIQQIDERLDEHDRRKQDGLRPVVS